MSSGLHLAKLRVLGRFSELWNGRDGSTTTCARMVTGQVATDGRAMPSRALHLRVRAHDRRNKVLPPSKNDYQHYKNLITD